MGGLFPIIFKQEGEERAKDIKINSIIKIYRINNTTKLE